MGQGGAGLGLGAEDESSKKLGLPQICTAASCVSVFKQYVLAMTSAFAQLPAAVLSEILWLTPFVDTLRCEQVCRSWRKVLKCSTAATEDLYPTWSPGVWGQELQLLVGTPEDDDAEPTLKHAQSLSSNRRIVITLVPSRNVSAHFYEMFLVWLTKHAAGFMKILILKSATESSWLFAHIVLAMGTASLSALPLFALRLNAGELYFDGFAQRLCLALCVGRQLLQAGSPA